MTQRIKIAALVVGAIVLAFGSIELGFIAGDVMGKADRERLSTIWPDVLRLPQETRVVLVRASLACDLQELPSTATRVDVARCLRVGAVKHDAKHEFAQPIAGQVDALLKNAQL